MSNWKKAYGWYGHIIIPKSQGPSDPQDNLVAVDEEAFNRLKQDFDDMKLHEAIQCHQIGYRESETMHCFLATGVGFSVGFTHYGTVFKNAGEHTKLLMPAMDYIGCMRLLYGIELPQCRFMIGCSTEH